MIEERGDGSLLARPGKPGLYLRLEAAYSADGFAMAAGIGGCSGLLSDMRAM